MRAGYYDALRVIYGLTGKIYYIEQKAEECYYLRQFLETKPEIIERLLESCKLEHETGLFLRNFVEVVLPLIAAELKLSKDWTYEGLYLAMLEAAAKLYKVPKYRIYTVEELLEEVRRKAAGKELTAETPEFVRVILNR